MTNISDDYGFVIWSFDYGQWWGPDERGYVDDLKDAGRYNPGEAGKIASNSILYEDVPVIEPLALKHGPPKFHPYLGDGYTQEKARQL